jgi:D-alanyl-D-alanine carboxypeptidase
LSTGAALTPRHRFRVASHSKAFTAAAIMLLVEQERLRLDDKVGQYVSDLPAPLAEVKISQLLSHSAGIMRDGTDCRHWDDLRPFPDEAALRRELSLPLVLDPGERLKYSNLGFGLLGMVIAAVTSDAFGTWIAREVVGKAGLTETAPDLPALNAEPMAAGHTGKLPLGRRVIPGLNATNVLAAATGFVATASDLARFFGQLDPAAPRSILSPASRREMTRRHWKSLHSETEHYYGFGIVSGSVRDHEFFGHSGGFQGFQSCCYVMPEWGVTVAVIVNAIDGAASDWIDGVLHIFDRFAKAGAPDAGIADWSGRWWNLWGALDLVPMGDKVLVASPDSLSPFSDAAEIMVASPSNGRITRANGFGSYGEAVERITGADGEPATLLLAGEVLLPEAAFVGRHAAAGS